LERLRIPEGCDRHVDAGTRLEERADIGGEHDCGGILGLDVRGIQREAMALEHVGYAAQGRRGVAVAVAGEPNDEAVADQLVIPPALDESKVLQARSVQGRTERQKD